jgi:SAM-dependent methyltransferase
MALKLDLGCGNTPQAGYLGVDITTEGTKADIAVDLFAFPWPWPDNSVEAIRCSHFFEHIPGKLRGPFMEEVWRIMMPGGEVMIMCPHARSNGAVQDLTHEWPPIVWESFLYFNRGFRKESGLDHFPYPTKCDFDFTYGDIPHRGMPPQTPEEQAFGIKHYWNAAQEIQVRMVARK